MSEAQQVILMVKGAMSELPADRREIAENYFKTLKEWVTANPTEAMIAVALAGAEAQGTA
jgi:hypothetical protein